MARGLRRCKESFSDAPMERTLPLWADMRALRVTFNAQISAPGSSEADIGNTGPREGSDVPAPSAPPDCDHMITIGWEDRLDVATTEPEVIALARDFLASFTPGEIGRLPESCRPRKLIDADDVTSYAFELAWRNCEDGDVIERFARFFSQASRRLSQILARAADSQDGQRRSA